MTSLPAAVTVALDWPPSYMAAQKLLSASRSGASSTMVVLTMFMGLMQPRISDKKSTTGSRRNRWRCSYSSVRPERHSLTSASTQSKVFVTAFFQLR